MELKNYQKKVLKELETYLGLLDATEWPADAFKIFWEQRGAPALGNYHNVIDRVPCVTLKVPTGGGKTFLACCAIKRIFNHFPSIRRKAVVWLVPSESILTQTLAALKNPAHPYRQQINADFSSRVEVYSKKELLAGQNFNQSTVLENLSVMVLSYDSFRRGKGKEALLAYKENSNLIGISNSLGAPETPIADADASSLFQIVNQLHPIIIVDESHHARSSLSLDMLKNFDPTFVLELTATPIEKKSNVVSYVDAVALKDESMVKLPVIVYNRPTSRHVLRDAIEMRSRLEAHAKEEEKTSGRYVRPIVLFQAEPRNKEDSQTFEDVKKTLLKMKISEEEIAIKTGDKNELKGVDLLSKKCRIRYIITVDALKEGWDCPFAYILASIANKSSVVSVEQILGRVLRLPHAAEFNNPILNMAYLLTSSEQFTKTLANIKIGLEYAGFTEREYAIGDESDLLVPAPAEPQQRNIPVDTGEEPLVLENLRIDLDAPQDEDESKAQEETNISVDLAFQNAIDAEKDYKQKAKENEDGTFKNISPEIIPNMKVSRVNEVFAEEIKQLRLPVFMLKLSGGTLFGRGVEGMDEPLTRESLTSGLKFAGQNTIINFSSAPVQMVQFDVKKSDMGRARVYDLDEEERDVILKHIQSLTPDRQKAICRDEIYNMLNRNNQYSATDLKNYIGQVLDNLDESRINWLNAHKTEAADIFSAKIEELMTMQQRGIFFKKLASEKIYCSEAYTLPSWIPMEGTTDLHGGSLYEREYGKMTDIEESLAIKLSGMKNIRWWHKIVERRKGEFFINGFINHYPDFMVMTERGNIVLIEAKGAHLANFDDTLHKIDLGEAWEKAAGKGFRYFMVFKDDAENIPKGSFKMSDFLDVLKAI